MQAEVSTMHGGMRGHSKQNLRRLSARRGMLGRHGIGSLAILACICQGAPASAYTAYVTNERDNTISVVDLDKMETVKTIPVGQRPRGIAVSPDGRFLYICAGDDDIVQIVDTKSLAVTGDLPSG